MPIDWTPERHAAALEAIGSDHTPTPWHPVAERRTAAVSTGFVCANIPPVRDGCRTIILATGLYDDFWSSSWGERPPSVPANQNAANAEYIAHACNNYPAAVAEIERLRADSDSQVNRLIDWIRDPNRKPPELAFTAGPLREAADEIELRAAGGWRSVGTAPQNKWVLGLNLNGKCSVVKGWRGDWSDDNGFQRSIVMWQPLPPQPTQAAEATEGSDEA